MRPAQHVGRGPCDAIETRKATDYLLLQHVGPKYIRFAREATPIVTREDTPFVFGKANVIRLRREAPEMLDAFEPCWRPNYIDEHEDLSIIACGPMVPEAMRAAWILKKEFGYETRVVNMHTMKPIDERGDHSRRERNRRRRYRRRAPDRRAGVARERRPHGEP